MSSNKKAKKELMRLYGKECFIEKLHLRPDTERHYTGKAQYHRMQQLTYHHIREKVKGGKSTVENGALLSAENHIWFNQQSKQDQRKMNKAFQDYKHSVDVHCVGLSFKEDNSIIVEKLQETTEIDFELPPELEAGVIELEFNSPEEQAQYEEYKKQRNEKTKKKFSYNEALDTNKKRSKAVLDAEWQDEIFWDNLDELRY